MNFPTLLELKGLAVGISAVGAGLNLNLPCLSSAAVNPLRLVYDQSGPVYNGPGSLIIREPFSLSKLDLGQREAVERAKKYAMDESFKNVLVKQALQLQRQPQQQQPTVSKREQTLNLLSRVYVGSISYDLKEESIKTAFQPFGPIKNVTLSWDAATQKHKGFAFVEFDYPEAAHLAISQMNNASLGGRQLKVGRPSNLPHAEPLINELITGYNIQKRIYVSDVHPGLSERELAMVFESFGTIISCKLQVDTSGANEHVGFGFIEYATEQSANDAVANMNLFDLGGHFLRVTKAISPRSEPTATKQMMPTPTSLAIGSLSAKILAIEAEIERSPRISETGHYRGSVYPTSIRPEQLPWDHVDLLESVGRFKFNSTDDYDEINETLTHPGNFFLSDRAVCNERMQRLIRPHCRGVLLLRNMVGPNDCDDDLENEITVECSIYGTVERVVIYQELDENGELIIKIFVVFQDAESVQRARDALNGRYFAGRQVIAELYEVEKFVANDLTG